MIRNLPVTDLDTELQTNSLTSIQANIWDVRDIDSYNEGHIEGATNNPINDGISSDTLNSTSGTVYVLCGGGSKAPRAAQVLEELDNSRDIVILTGGTREAKSAGMNIVVK